MDADTPKTGIKARFQDFLERQRLQLSSPNALSQIAVLGLISGLATGGVIAGFRLLIELIQSQVLQVGFQEDFGALAPHVRAALPASGALLCIIVAYALRQRGEPVGVLHVLVRLSYHQGRLPLRPMISQFLGGVAAIASGHSVGREGPGIHLGAATSSLIGQRLGLPNNSLRTLVACGSAAAIAASFNTPLAGVVFAMEVVMMEYTLFGFTPVILAAVAATIVTRFLFGDAPTFQVPHLQFGSLLELPYLVVFGLVLGIIAGIFVHLLQQTTRRTQKWPVWIRLALAGTVGAGCATVVPEAMGVSYSSVNQALAGTLAIELALALLAMKLFASALAVGLGIPGGLIGPLLVIGASAGLVLGVVGDQLVPTHAAEPGFYTLLGMATMMGATLQAPLAALICILELTGNPNFLLPGMLTVVTAMLASRRLLRKDSVYLELMRTSGLDYRNDPISQSLRRTGVAGAMDKQVEVVSTRLTREEAETLLKRKPQWLLIQRDKGQPVALRAADLARYLAEKESDSEATTDLIQIPAARLQAAPINIRANLQEAYEQLSAGGNELLYVENQTIPGTLRVYGVLTREHIEKTYR
ncbi:MAG: chloride channel protein [Pseudomonadota bacterium]|nr:chloride channel protein [Pseudomonadota bacterium]